MFAGSLILAVTLMVFAAWLQFNEQRGWGDEDDCKTDLDKQYHKRRSRSRRRTNLMVGICGLLILIAAFVGPGPVWIAAWLCVLLCMVTVIGLAALDVLRTHRYQNAKMQKLMNQRDR
ncbi:hypothetical protein Poly59_60810 [Rubripirellula reticaptiva]|uniref:Uncharacterized protein n=2 Tax=Rubripirellula reticaptiva TaxID=2528013 RepID=A0A5C6EGF0_9BACT|nr:hypothetical protein Poly59_60810 [Rubripirellula reticaptiva]